MRPFPIVVVAVALACAFSLALNQLMLAPQSNASITEPGPEAPSASEILERLESLEAEIRDIRKELEPGIGVAERKSASGIDEAELRAAVRAELARLQGELPTTARSAGGVGKDGKPSVEALLAQLADPNLNQSDMATIWKKISDNGLMDEALKRFKEGVQMKPNDPQSHFHLGSAYLQALQYEPNGMQKGVLATKADQAFDKTLELDERHWDARFSKALSLSFWPSFLGKRGESIRHFEILLSQQEGGQRETKHAQTYVFLGNLYQESGKPKKAQEIWQRGLRYFPNDPQLRGRVKQR